MGARPSQPTEETQETHCARASDKDVAGAKMSADMVEISRTVLLTEAQHESLENELLQEPGVERTPAKGSEPSQSQSFYDNDDMSLTLRGWWLSQSGAGDWLLRVPVYKPVPGDGNSVRYIKHEVVTGGEEILERLGLQQHAQLFKAGKQTSLEKLLSQAGVQTCGVIYSKQVLFTLSAGSAPVDATGQTPNALCKLTADGRRLSVTLEALRLDVKYGENQAVANLLFMMGNAARSALKPTVAKFTLKAEASPGLNVSELRSDLAAWIKTRNLADVVPAKEAQSSIWAYLATLRPLHLQRLYKGVVFQSPQPDLAEPQDDDMLPPSAALPAARDGFPAETVPLAEVD